MDECTARCLLAFENRMRSGRHVLHMAKYHYQEHHPFKIEYMLAACPRGFSRINHSFVFSVWQHQTSCHRHRRRREGQSKRKKMSGSGDDGDARIQRVCDMRLPEKSCGVVLGQVRSPRSRNRVTSICTKLSSSLRPRAENCRDR